MITKLNLKHYSRFNNSFSIDFHCNHYGFIRNFRKLVRLYFFNFETFVWLNCFLVIDKIRCLILIQNPSNYFQVQKDRYILYICSKIWSWWHEVFYIHVCLYTVLDTKNNIFYVLLYTIYNLHTRNTST